MSTLSRYVLRRLVTPFAMALTVMLLVLALERLLRIVQLLGAQGAPIARALEILGYLVPHYLGLAVPAALFIAVLVEVRRLHAGSELAAILAAGVPLRFVLRPIVGLSLSLMAIMLLIAGFVQPHARYAYRSAVHEVNDAVFAFRLQPGTFHKVDDRLFVRAEKVSRDGRQISHFFATTTERDGSRTVIMARGARVRGDELSGEVILHLYDGNIVWASTRPRRGLVEFDEYVWKPPVAARDPRGPRGRDERELTLTEIVHGGVPGLPPRATPQQMRAELHGRLIHAVSIPLLAVLAVPLALIGRGRTGRAYGFVLGIALLVLYEKTVGLGESLAAEGALPAWAGVWGPFLALLLVAWLLMVHASETNGQNLVVWVSHKLRKAGTPRLKPAE